jgi:ABC-type lipoprotein release transport system permease subunit
VLAHALAKTNPERYRKWDEILNPLYQSERGIVSALFPVMLILMAVAILVLLIASANVANLLLARATTRIREMGIRLALGASRARLLRQLLTESLLIASLGGILGVLMVGWAAGLLRYFLPSVGGFSTALDLSLDWRVLVFCFVVTLITGVVFGFAPAVAASKFEVTGAADFYAAASSSGRWRFLSSRSFQLRCLRKASAFPST